MCFLLSSLLLLFRFDLTRIAPRLRHVITVHHADADEAVVQLKVDKKINTTVMKSNEKKSKKSTELTGIATESKADMKSMEWTTLYELTS